MEQACEEGPGQGRRVPRVEAVAGEVQPEGQPGALDPPQRRSEADRNEEAPAQAAAPANCNIAPRALEASQSR